MTDPAPRPDPFRLMDSTLTVLSVGLVSQTLRELRDYLALAPPNSITYHFHGSLLGPMFDDPEYPNDFALWARRRLHDQVLAERLAVLDALDFPNVEDLRQEILDILDDRLAEHEVMPQVPRGSEFHFQSSQLIVFDTGMRFDSPLALAKGAHSFTSGSVFYHFIEARRRPPLRIDDFSQWLQGWGVVAEPAIARLETIDPIFWTLTELRELISRSLELVPQAEPVS